MKRLFLESSDIEKNRILEMHSVKTKTIFESAEEAQMALSKWNSESEENKEGFFRALMECLGERKKTLDRKGNIVDKGKLGIRLLKDLAITVGSAFLTVFMAIKHIGPVDEPQATSMNPVAGAMVFPSIGGFVLGGARTIGDISDIVKCVKEKMKN